MAPSGFAVAAFGASALVSRLLLRTPSHRSVVAPSVSAGLLIEDLLGCSIGSPWRWLELGGWHKSSRLEGVGRVSGGKR